MLYTLAFLDVGGSQLIILAIIGLLLFGKDLPTISRKAGKVLANLKRTVSEVSVEIQREMNAAADSAEEGQKQKAELAAQQPPGAESPGAEHVHELNVPPPQLAPEAGENPQPTALPAPEPEAKPKIAKAPPPVQTVSEAGAVPETVSWDTIPIAAQSGHVPGNAVPPDDGPPS